MHCLEVIVKRNARAAGRELAHADHDGKHSPDATLNLCRAPYSSPEWEAFWAGYSDGQRDSEIAGDVS